jgi:hypothetical protein
MFFISLKGNKQWQLEFKFSVSIKPIEAIHMIAFTMWEALTPMVSDGNSPKKKQFKA